MSVKILILCSGNSCRSQMAEGFLNYFDANLYVRSAGTEPAARVNPNAVRVMQEIGIDISKNMPENVDKYSTVAWDYVITVCGHARENCPVFTGKVKKRLHLGYDDPADAFGTDDQILAEFRRIRDQIKEGFKEFYHSIKSR